MFSATRQRLEQRKVLEHHADAEAARLRRAGDGDGAALPEDGALVRRQRAVEHLHQRRLAGAVLAEQRVDFAAADFEADMVAGGELPEALGEPLGRQKRRADRGSPRLPVQSDPSLPFPPAAEVRRRRAP